MSFQMECFSIRHLAEVPEALPALVRWFVEEWAPYYGLDGPGDAEADLMSASDSDQLPICLVALDREGQLLGTIALKKESISHHHLSPWLAAFLVASDQRGRGIGSALIVALEHEARRLGYNCIYMSAGGAETDMPPGEIERRGWRAFDQAPTLRGTVTVYVLNL